MVLGVSTLSSLRRMRSKRNMTNLKRSTSTGSSQAPLLVAKQSDLPLPRPCFIRRALATANNLRHHPSAVADSRTITDVENQQPADSHGCAQLHQHSPASTSSSTCSDNMSIYTSGSSRNIQEPPPACCGEQQRIVTHPPITHPFDEDSTGVLLVAKHCETDFTSIDGDAQEVESEEQELIATHPPNTHPFDEYSTVFVTKHCETDFSSIERNSWKAERNEQVGIVTPSTQPFDEDAVDLLLASQHCNSPDRLAPLFAFIEENAQDAVSEYEDPTFVPEDSTVEESLAEPLRAPMVKKQPAAPSQKPPVHPAKQSSKTLRTEDPRSVDERFALGLQLLDQAKRLLSNECREEEALQMFRQAVLHFEPAIAQQQQHECTSHRAVAGLLHSARCHRYMSSIVTDAHDAVRLLHAVVRLYDLARERVEMIVESKIISEDESAASNSIGRQAAKPATRVCLDTMIMETLQFQADVLIKRLGDYEQAVVCYEEILRQLLYLEEVRGWDGVMARSVLLDDINFVFMSKEKHTDVLREALSVLVGYYGTLLPLYETFSFVVCEDGLNLFRIRQEEDYSDDDEMIDTVASLYKQLSEIYMSRHESDRAVLALRDYAVVKLTASGKPCSEALQVIEKMGKTYEQMENYSDALECYELALLCRCRHYGNTHVSVAKALVNVARMKELQDGNTDESVNLYRAANAIFSLHVKTDIETAKDNTQSSTAFRAVPSNLKPLRSSSSSDDNNSHDIESTTSTTVPQQSLDMSMESEKDVTLREDSVPCAEKATASAAVESMSDSTTIPEQSSVSMDPPGDYSGPSARKGTTSVAVQGMPEEDESDDDSDVKLMELPFQYSGYMQNDGDDVRTVFSSDNDIVTLASSSVITASSRTQSSRSFGQSDIVSMGTGTCVVGTEGERLPEKKKSPDCAVLTSMDEEETARSEPPETKSFPFIKIFSLADTLKRMQHARQVAKERKSKDPSLSSSTCSVGANRSKQESDGISRGMTKGNIREAPSFAGSNQATLLDSPLRRRAELHWI